MSGSFSLKRLVAFCFFIFIGLTEVFGQTFFRDFPVVSEKSRRSVLTEKNSIIGGLRPETPFNSDSLLSIPVDGIRDLSLRILPLYAISRYNSQRPYGWGDFGMIPGVGFQQYLSSGIEGRWKFLYLKLQPELVLAQNKSYQGFGNNFPNSVIQNKFYHWNRGDYPERVGNSAYSRFWWGQSKLTLQYGAFEIGASTSSIWWGPGQWNSLSFSNNAEGVPILSLNTRKPAKTFLGNFETALIMGKLQSSNTKAAQNQELNDRFFRRLPTDWRFLNALMVDYSPKWVPDLHLGFVRTFQVYDSLRGNSLYDWFPVFEPFQKKNFFNGSSTEEFDANGRDQQVVLYGKYAFKKAKAEIYFEWGRRDHAYNWRDFILTPEHARAYNLGFIKLIDLSKAGRYLQLRGEITQQQESINRVIRYSNPGGFASWHMHGQARGFTNRGQALGVGLGQGANVQTLEVAFVEGWSKMGILLERLENDQGFFYRSFYIPSENKPWVDLSLGFLYDKRFGNLILSSKFQLIHARNYQWQLDPASTPQFPKGENLTSVLGQVSAVYFWKKK